jgi:hypothetical protein
MDRQGMSARARTVLLRMLKVERSVRRRAQQHAQQEGRAERLNRQRRQIVELRTRVEELESDMRECMRLSKRVAEVTDIVAEVLLPAANRDDEELRRRLDRYAETL